MLHGNSLFLASSLSRCMAAEVIGGSFDLGTPGTGDAPLPLASNFFFGKIADQYVDKS